MPLSWLHLLPFAQQYTFCLSRLRRVKPSFAQHTVCHSCLWHLRTKHPLSVLDSPYSLVPANCGTADSLHACGPVLVLVVGRVSAAAPCLYLWQQLSQLLTDLLYSLPVIAHCPPESASCVAYASWLCCSSWLKALSKPCITGQSSLLRATAVLDARLQIAAKVYKLKTVRAPYQGCLLTPFHLPFSCWLLLALQPLSLCGM